MSENQFSDQIDRANHIADMATQEAINHYSRLAEPEQRKDAAGNWETLECVDCGEDIESARLEMGRVRCFACQSAKEKKARPYAG